MSNHGGSKRRRWPWIVGGIAVVLVIAASCGSGGSTPTTGSTAAPATSVVQAPAADSSDGKIVYEVTGSGTANNVTYSSNGSGGQSQVSKAKMPWTKTVDAESVFGFYSLVAQNGGGSGKITCKITKDGEVIGEGESEGPYAVVTCNGS